MNTIPFLCWPENSNAEPLKRGQSKRK